MSWNLQQINGGGATTVPGEYVACPQAPAAFAFDLNVFGQFVCTFGNQQHFSYIDNNFNLQDCWYDGDAGRWNLQQVNNATGQPTVPGEYVACPQATAIAALGPFVCTFGNQQHFTYVDSNANLQDCWYDGDAGRWNLQQINGGGATTVPGEYVACPQAPALSGRTFGMFVCTFGNQQHFTYPDGNGNLQDCWYDGDAGRWNLQQINNATGQPTVPGEYVACPQAAALIASPPFVCTFGNQQHFNYVDGNGNVQDCWWEG